MAELPLGFYRAWCLPTEAWITAAIVCIACAARSHVLQSHFREPRCNAECSMLHLQAAAHCRKHEGSVMTYLVSPCTGALPESVSSSTFSSDSADNCRESIVLRRLKTVFGCRVPLGSEGKGQRDVVFSTFSMRTPAARPIPYT